MASTFSSVLLGFFIFWGSVVVAQPGAHGGASDAARAILDRAIAVQTPGGVKPLTSYQAEYRVDLYEDDQGREAPQRSGVIRQSWQRGPGRRSSDYHRMLKLSTGDEPPIHYISDGRMFWSQVEGQAARDLASDPSLERDYTALKAEVKRTDELMRLFFLGNLDGEETKVRLGRTDLTRPVNPEKPRRGTVPIDEIIVEPKGERPIALRIGREDGRLYEAERVGGGETGDLPQVFKFSYHEELDDARLGKVLVPTRVAYWKGSRIVLQANVPVATAPLSQLVKFNESLPQKTFKPAE
jgi:hypothetical protein